MLNSCATKRKKFMRLAFLINVDWYFLLHWKDRALAAKKNGYDIYVFTNITSARTRAEIEQLGFSIVNIPISRQNVNPFSEFVSAFRVVSELRIHSIDVVHAITIKPVIYASLLRYLKPYPTIMSFPGLGALVSAQGVMKNLFWLAAKLCLAASASDRNVFAIFENRDDINSLRSKGIRFKNSQVILGAGVDVQYFRPIGNSTGRGLRVLFAARLLRNKGLFDLIRATEALRQAGYEIELHVAGIADREHSDAIAEEDIDDLSQHPGIVWHGQVDNIPELMNNVDAICLPTTYGEGVPRVLIEGAACGKPLVATDVPGCREIVVDDYNGFLVSPGFHMDLVAALKRLADSPELQGIFGRKGRDLVEKSFSNEFVIDRTMQVYSDVFLRHNAGFVSREN